ncbi:hypothetical protein LX36DRAFT_455352 [Colletotrichum falcatum]|nr:hypothetical protein LX36DRAFT_455352 [Colletotrichum falcatum]
MPASSLWNLSSGNKGRCFLGMCWLESLNRESITTKSASSLSQVRRDARRRPSAASTAAPRFSNPAALRGRLLSSTLSRRTNVDDPVNRQKKRVFETRLFYTKPLSTRKNNNGKLKSQTRPGKLQRKSPIESPSLPRTTALIEWCALPAFYPHFFREDRSRIHTDTCNAGVYCDLERLLYPPDPTIQRVPDLCFSAHSSQTQLAGSQKHLSPVSSRARCTEYTTHLSVRTYYTKNWRHQFLRAGPGGRIGREHPNCVNRDFGCLDCQLNLVNRVSPHVLAMHLLPVMSLIQQR